MIKEAQTRLNAAGFDPGPIDGAMGPRTRAAIVKFQAQHKLQVDGVLGPETMTALRRETGAEGVPVASILPGDMPVWLAEMRRRKGLHEQRDANSLMAWLRQGRYLGDPRKNPWCGDATETCFAVTLPDEPLPSNPFWAQSWAKFGVACGPIVGAVGVIRWGPTTGHVGLITRATPKYIWMDGGNQGNSVSNARFPTNKFIAFRWPSTVPIKYYPELVSTGGSGGGIQGTR